MSKRWLLLVALVISGVIAAGGCGGSDSQVEGVWEVEKSVRGAEATDSVSCERAGYMVFVGEREFVYDCLIKTQSLAYRDCFVYIEGAVEVVTEDIAEGEAGSDFRCAGRLLGKPEALAATGRPGRERLTTEEEKNAYDDAYYTCNPNLSSKPREEYLQAIASLYGAASSEPADLAAAVVRSNASVAESEFERSARATQIWREACLDALASTE